MSDCIRPDKAGLFPLIKYGEVTNVALGNGTMFRIATLGDKHGLFVAVEGSGAYTFSVIANWSYVQSKLGLKYESDARHIADFINDQMIRSDPRGKPRQGKYEEAFTS